MVCYFRFAAAILFLRAQMVSATQGNLSSGMAIAKNLHATVGTIQVSCLVAEIQLLPVYGRHIDFSATRSVGYVI
jgi:hypothetical protein